ncbi:MAG: phosphopyruvate hydratase, partial [Candidatus Geothermarchaeales archaeon]
MARLRQSLNYFEIDKVRGREVLDCRGAPTVEVDISTRSGAVGRASVPSGLSTSRYEAVEVRDGGSRYDGKGVLNAVKNVNEKVGPRLSGTDVRNQKGIDDLLISLDGTDDKSALGSNAILGVSLASARAAAEASNVPLYKYLGDSDAKILPIPLFNILGGGKLAG